MITRLKTVIGRQTNSYPIHWLIFLLWKLKLKKKSFYLLFSSPSQKQGSGPERSFAIASDFPEVHLHSLSLDIKLQRFFCPPCSWWSFSARCTTCMAILSPHRSSPKILCCRQPDFTQGRQPGRGPGARGGRSFAFHVEYSWWMMLREGLRKPNMASSEGGHCPRAREFPFGTEQSTVSQSSGGWCSWDDSLCWGNGINPGSKIQTVSNMLTSIICPILSHKKQMLPTNQNTHSTNIYGTPAFCGDLH